MLTLLGHTFFTKYVNIVFREREYYPILGGNMKYLILCSDLLVELVWNRIVHGFAALVAVSREYSIL